MPGSGPEPWMMELARMLILKDLPTGVIVGSAVITQCRMHSAECRTAEEAPLFEWHLTDVERVKKLRKPKGQPQPVWFYPFG